MLVWILGIPIQYIGHMKILGLGNFSAYFILPEIVEIFIIELYGFLGTLWDLLFKYLLKVFALFQMVIFRVVVVWCTILNAKGFHILASLGLYFRFIYSYKEGFLIGEHLGILVFFYPVGGVK